MSQDVAPLPKLTPEYMRKMYPNSLELVQAQVFFRHGERTPVKNNLYPNSQWLFCRRANYLHSEFMKAINKFVPIQDKNAILLPGIEYEPAQFSAKLSPSLEPTGNDFGGPSKKKSTAEWHPHACAPGQLTDIGLDSMYRAGAHLRSLYVDNLKFIPSETANKEGLLKSWLYIRSTDYTRVVQSTYALLSGLYPTRHPGAASDPLLWEPLDARFLNLYPIYARMHNYETLHANFSCPKVMREYTLHLAKDACKIKYIDDVYQQFSQLPMIGEAAKELMDQPAFGSNFHVLYDELTCRRIHGLKISKEVSSDMLTTLGMAAHEQWIAPIRQLEGQRLGFGKLLKEIALTMKQAASIKKDDERPLMTTEQTKGDMRVAPGGIRASLQFETHRVPKLALYAGHDITLAPLAAIFGSMDHHWLPFGSMLAIELFRDKEQKEDHFVRVQMNGTVLKMPQCQAPGNHHPEMGSSMCTMKAFMENMAKVTPTEKELESACSKKKVFW